MKLGAHNSFSYLPPRKWWMRLLLPFARCQEKTLHEQWANGVRLFDVRVRFDDDDEPYFAHGIVAFKDTYPARIFLNYIVTKSIVLKTEATIRMVLETNKPDERQEKLFKELCEYYDGFGRVIVVDGVRKFDWKQIYECPYSNVTQLCGSMQSTYGKLLPWLWHKINKNKVSDMIEEYSYTDERVLVDFL